MYVLQLTWQKFLAGGIYMFPIFLVSFLMFALIMHCLYTYWTFKRTFRQIRRAEREEGREEELPAERQLGDIDAGLAGLMAEYRQSRCPVPELNVRLREELTNNFLSRLGTEGKSVLLCASIAMLLGLLGTISGMINAFEAIQTFGVGNTKSFASGISEALLTTQSGLLVGVTGVMAGQLIKRMNKRLKFKLYRYFEGLENQEARYSGEYSYGA